jgi:mono/diheme cytochrome c family protein
MVEYLYRLGRSAGSNHHERLREYIMKAQTLTMVLPVGFAVIVTLAACGSKEAPPSSPAAASTEATAPAAAPAAPAATAAADGGIDGAQIYKLNCSSCHGVEGKGDGVAAAALNPKPVNFAAGDFKYDTNGNGTPGEIADIMTIIRDGTAKHGGSPLMAPWPLLSEAQRQAVAEYVKSFHTS